MRTLARLITSESRRQRTLADGDGHPGSEAVELDKIKAMGKGAQQIGSEASRILISDVGDVEVRSRLAHQAIKWDTQRTHIYQIVESRFGQRMIGFEGDAIGSFEDFDVFGFLVSIRLDGVCF